MRHDFYSALVRRSTAIIMALSLAACGGIEGTGSPIAGIEGTGNSEGGVTGFGSVFVNGVEYSTDRADIIMNNLPASEEDLQVGMLVSVAGDVAEDGLTGVARKLVFDWPLSGPIDAIDRGTRVLTLLGQPVRLDDSTLYGETSEDALAEGQFCQVSAYPTADGGWLASLLQCSDGYVAGQSVVEAEGLVSALDVGSGRFRIGQLEVDTNGAMIDTRDGALADGALVEVTGHQPQRRGVLQAQSVRVKSASLAEGHQVILEGVIGHFAGLGDFDLGRRQVDASNAQREDAHAIAPANGVRMRLRGVVGSDAVVRATHYALQPVADILLTGRLDEVDMERNRLTLFGGERQALQFTQYEDRSPDRKRRFRLRDLRAGDYAQLRGFLDAQDRLVVTRIERRTEEEPSSGTVVARVRIGLGSFDPVLAQVRGPLNRSSLINNSLTIAGVEVATDNSRTEFVDRNGASTTSVQFYNDLQPGDRLYAEGNESNDVLQATRVAHVR